MNAEGIIGVIFALICTAGPIMLGIIGLRTEKKHFARLAIEEKEYADIVISDMKYLPPNWNAQNASMVVGSVVISNDYLKSFIAAWINFFGGRITCYETLLERGRREAVLRMTKQAVENGANVVWNVRVATAPIGASEESKRVTGVEVIAYGTAMRVSKQ